MALDGLTDHDIHQARQWLAEFATDARGDVPLKLHAIGTGDGGAPPFTDAFNGYIGDLICQNPDCKDPDCIQRRRPIRQVIESAEYRERKRGNTSNRTTRALRKLRRVAPLEFDVLYLALMQGLSIAQIVDRLNDRAARKGTPNETFNTQAVLTLVVTGAGKMRAWF